MNMCGADRNFVEFENGSAWHLLVFFRICIANSFTSYQPMDDSFDKLMNESNIYWTRQMNLSCFLMTCFLALWRIHLTLLAELRPPFLHNCFLLSRALLVGTDWSQDRSLKTQTNQIHIYEYLPEGTHKQTLQRKRTTSQTKQKHAVAWHLQKD